MNCRECTNLLYDYLDNELDSENYREVEAHFSICDSCQKEWSKIQEVRDLLHRHIQDATNGLDLVNHVMTQIVDEEVNSSIPTQLKILGLLLFAIFSSGTFFLLPAFYATLRPLLDLAMNVLLVPVITLAAFPMLKFTCIASLVAVLCGLTWAMRRVDY